MTRYRFLRSGRDGRTTGATTFFEAGTEADALLKAIELSTPDDGGEIWDGVRLVAQVPPR